MENECEALPGVAYPGVRDNRSTINTKTGYDDDDDDHSSSEGEEETGWSKDRLAMRGSETGALVNTHPTNARVPSM